MKTIHGLLILVLILTMAQSCSNKVKTSSGSPQPGIQFGRTGGFTNIPDEYRINDKGQVFRITREGSTQINDISRKEMKSICKILDTIDFQHLQMNEPGNISYYIKVISSDYEKSVTWNDQTSNSPIKDLYKKLLATIKP
jgi:hypothetical protein